MADSVPIPEPTADDLARDAAADLAVCEAATEGPWVVMAEGLWQGDPLEKPRSIAHPRPDLAERFPAKDGYGPVFHEEHICLAWGVKRENLALIALARTALPAWIRRAEAEQARAEKAEAEVAHLRIALDAISSALQQDEPRSMAIAREALATLVDREAGRAGPGSAHPAGE